MSAVIPKCQHDADAAVGHVQHTHSQSHRKMNYSFSFMAFVDGGSGCRCRKIKTSLRDKQVSLSLTAAQEGGRAARRVPGCHSEDSAALRQRPASSVPARYLFLDHFFVEMSEHQSEATFPLPVSEANIIKEKNQCVLKQKRKVNSFHGLYI